MIKLSQKLAFKKNQKHIELLFGACWHIGQMSVDYDGIRTFIKKAKKNPWFHQGDLIEAIVPADSRRFNVEEHQITILDQIAYAEELMRPAASTCLGICTGNHENTLSKQFGNITRDIAKSLGVPFLGMCAFDRLVCPDGYCDVYVAHGSKGFGGNAGDIERIKLNRQIKLRNNNKKMIADIVAVSHAHTSVITAPSYKMRLGYTPDKVKLLPVAVEPVWYSACPSMFKTYVEGNDIGSYGELAQFEASDIGFHSAIIERDGSVPKMRQYGSDGKIIEEYTPNIIR